MSESDINPEAQPGSRERNAKRGEPWWTCRNNHILAIPADLFDALSDNQKERLYKFEGLVLEVLPIEKRAEVELAVANNLLSIDEIGEGKSFVSELRRDSVWGLIRSNSPKIRIKDLFTNERDADTEAELF